MIIRKTKLADIKKCLELQRLDNENYWNENDFKLAIKDKLVIFLVAEDENKIAGYIIGFTTPTKRSDAMLHETRTRKDLRGKGIGTKLVNEFCKEAFDKGAKDIYALIEPELSKFYIESCKFNKSHVWTEVKKSK